MSVYVSRDDCVGERCEVCECVCYVCVFIGVVLVVSVSGGYVYIADMDEFALAQMNFQDLHFCIAGVQLWRRGAVCEGDVLLHVGDEATSHSSSLLSVCPDRCVGSYVWGFLFSIQFGFLHQYYVDFIFGSKLFQFGMLPS